MNAFARASGVLRGAVLSLGRLLLGGMRFVRHVLTRSERAIKLELPHNKLELPDTRIEPGSLPGTAVEPPDVRPRRRLRLRNKPRWGGVPGGRPPARPTAEAEQPLSHAEPPIAYAEPPTREAEPPPHEAEPPAPAPPPVAAEPPLGPPPVGVGGEPVPPSGEPAGGGTRSLPPNGGGPPPPLPPALPPVATDGEPPHSAYGLLDAPEEVVVGQEFELTVGLAAEQQPGVAGPPLALPPLSADPFVLTIDVDSDGFALDEPEGWRNDLDVSTKNPYPTLTLHVTPASQRDDVRTTKLEATFSVEGQVIGLAVRVLRVKRAGVPVATGAAAVGVTMTLPPAKDAPDITIKIRRWESPSGGLLHWSVETPHDIAIPKTSESDIGDEPQKLALDLVRQMTSREGKPGMYEVLLGTGITVADNVPTEVLTALRDVAAKVKPEPPTCLLLSEEPYVPWELAVLDPPLDATQRPFLATQAVVGRWILRDRPPPLPTPPTALEVRDIAVVSGVYNQVPGWPRLEEAEEEASDLQRDFGAVPVDASTEPLLDCLRGTPRADVLHFAVHGKYDPWGAQRGLVLVDQQMLIPPQIRSARPMKATPFVFLNACQAGSGEDILGDYGGLAAAFLQAGASGVIAPLWSIDDKLARSIALDFYKEVLEQGARPADALARTRRAIATEGSTSGTALAYQFFGHPLMQLAAMT